MYIIWRLAFLLILRPEHSRPKSRPRARIKIPAKRCYINVPFIIIIIIIINQTDAPLRTFIAHVNRTARVTIQALQSEYFYKSAYLRGL